MCQLSGMICLKLWEGLKISSVPQVTRCLSRFPVASASVPALLPQNWCQHSCVLEPTPFSPERTNNPIPRPSAQPRTPQGLPSRLLLFIQENCGMERISVSASIPASKFLCPTGLIQPHTPRALPFSEVHLQMFPLCIPTADMQGLLTILQKKKQNSKKKKSETCSRVVRTALRTQPEKLAVQSLSLLQAASCLATCACSQCLCPVFAVRQS